MTTRVDVPVKPFCKTHLGRAGNRLREAAGPVPFLIMQSNGGLVKHSPVAERPVTMLLSGPAAGLPGALEMAGRARFRNLLTIDVGGTSTDVAIIEDGRPMFTAPASVEGYPVRTPMLDIVTVGAGGGSIAWTDPCVQLKVGPHGAGADPGPIRYGRGGDRPTVTDAAVVLGLLPASLIGGDLVGVRAAWEDLKRLGIADIRVEGIPEARIALVADLRCFGEGHEVQVDIPGALSGTAAVAHMWEAFHGVHDRTFGFRYEGQQDVELVNLRVQAEGIRHRPDLVPGVSTRPESAPSGRRRVYWRGAGSGDCPLWRRTELAAGQRVAGPAVVEENSARPSSCRAAGGSAPTPGAT